jgi:HSP20 family protein
MMNIVRYDPFWGLADQVFDGFFTRPAIRRAVAPRVKLDVTEQDGAFRVLAEIPGVKKEDIQVTIDGDQVSISAEVRSEKEEKDGERVVHSERYRGKVSRAFRLADEVDEAQAEAKYADGVLELRLPKKAGATSHQITVH